MAKLIFKSNIKLEDIDAMSEEDIKNLTTDDLYELELQRKEKSHIKHRASLEASAQDLRTQVLIHGVSAIEKVQQSLISGVKMTAVELQAYDMLWPIIETLISKTEDLKKIQASNAKDVLKLLGEGKLTMKESMAMMALIKDQVAIDELPNLLAKLAEIGE